MSPQGGFIALAYDGADASHLEVAMPALERHGLFGTFFLEPVRFLQRAQDWQNAGARGHEMGCGCLFSAADARGNLSNWTLEMVEDELRENRKLLAETFERQSDFSFAYPGAETGCLTVPFNPMATSYKHMVERVFSVARSGIQGLNVPETCDFGNLKFMSGEGMDGDALLGIAKDAASMGAWAILTFRGIGVGSMGTDAKAHEELCMGLGAIRGLELGTMLKTAYRIRSAREAPAHSTFLKEV